MKKNITYPSSDGKTMIHAVMWLPEGETVSTVKPRAIVQLVHGMLEYIERYDAFAKFLTKQGFLVVGNDHLGHGQSVTSVENWGFIADATDVNSPADFMIHDMNRLYLGVHKKFPNVPYFILGHSMGSYLLRRYLAYEGDRFAGAIVMGTGDLPNSVTIPGMALVHTMAKAKGWHYRSTMIRDMSYSAPYQKFDCTGKDITKSWLSREVESVHKYMKDPRNTYVFTLNGYDALMSSVCFDHEKQNINMIPKSLPILLISGEDDPVGDLGKGVKRVHKAYKEAGIFDLTMKLFPNDRHEILNEVDKADVFKYIYGWIERRIH